MSNIDNPNGAKPVGTLSGAPWQGLVRSYMADGSGADIFIGDFVEMNTDGYIDVAAAGSVEIIGVCVGIQPAQAGQTNMVTDHYMSTGVGPDLSRKYYDASVDGATWLLVVTGPDVLYEIQEDGDTSDLALTDIGRNADLVDPGGSTTKGHSLQEIDSDSVADATGQLRIVAPINRPGNELGDWARWTVRVNENHYTKIAGV